MSESLSAHEEQPQETSTERYLRVVLGIDPSENPEYTVIDLHGDVEDSSTQ